MSISNKQRNNNSLGVVNEYTSALAVFSDATLTQACMLLLSSTSHASTDDASDATVCSPSTSLPSSLSASPPSIPVDSTSCNDTNESSSRNLANGKASSTSSMDSKLVASSNTSKERDKLVALYYRCKAACNIIEKSENHSHNINNMKASTAIAGGGSAPGLVGSGKKMLKRIHTNTNSRGNLQPLPPHSQQQSQSPTPLASQQQQQQQASSLPNKHGKLFLAPRKSLSLHALSKNRTSKALSRTSSTGSSTSNCSVASSAKNSAAMAAMKKKISPTNILPEANVTSAGGGGGVMAPPKSALNFLAALNGQNLNNNRNTNTPSSITPNITTTHSNSIIHPKLTKSSSPTPGLAVSTKTSPYSEFKIPPPTTAMTMTMTTTSKQISSPSLPPAPTAPSSPKRSARTNKRKQSQINANVNTTPVSNATIPTMATPRTMRTRRTSPSNNNNNNGTSFSNIHTTDPKIEIAVATNNNNTTITQSSKRVTRNKAASSSMAASGFATLNGCGGISSKISHYQVGDEVHVQFQGTIYLAIVKDVQLEWKDNDESGEDPQDGVGGGKPFISYVVEFDNGEVYENIPSWDVSSASEDDN